MLMMTTNLRFRSAGLIPTELTLRRRDYGEEALAEIGRSYNVSRLDDFEASEVAL